MSAVVCGKRSSLFEEIHPPVVPKRLRCAGGSSPVRYASSSRSEAVQSLGDAVLQLKGLFPEMDEQLIEKVLEASGDNIDYAIRSLNELRLSSDVANAVHLPGETPSTSSPLKSGEESAPSVPSEHVNHDNVSQDPPAQSEGSKWVELFVTEMLNASNLDDARSRAARALEALEKTLMSRSGSMLEELQKENAVLKEQLQCMVRDNQILKRAVAIQHERQAEHEACAQEIKQLKQLVSQYQEQIRTLELNNYALNLHLRQAQDGASIPGRFHPDVF